jgi:hypothetical protein
MRVDSLKNLDLILSLSKDEARILMLFQQPAAYLRSQKALRFVTAPDMR